MFSMPQNDRADLLLQRYRTEPRIQRGLRRVETNRHRASRCGLCRSEPALRIFGLRRKYIGYGVSSFHMMSFYLAHSVLNRIAHRMTCRVWWNSGMIRASVLKTPASMSPSEA